MKITNAPLCAQVIVRGDREIPKQKILRTVPLKVGRFVGESALIHVPGLHHGYAFMWLSHIIIKSGKMEGCYVDILPVDGAGERHDTEALSNITKIFRRTLRKK